MTDNADWLRQLADALEFNDSNDMAKWTVRGKSLTAATLARLATMTDDDYDAVMTPAEKSALAAWERCQRVAAEFKRQAGLPEELPTHDALTLMPTGWRDQFAAAMRTDTPRDAA